MLNIFIDGDACPVKKETYKVAERYQLTVYVVANQYINVPMSTRIRMEVVTGSFDAADDWIVQRVEKNDIVITSDILLAKRCIEKGAKLIGPKGNELDENTIGNAISGRDIAEHLRDLGHQGTGPSTMTSSDRSKFLSKLDQIIQKIKK